MNEFYEDFKKFVSSACKKKVVYLSVKDKSVLQTFIQTWHEKKVNLNNVNPQVIERLDEYINFCTDEVVKQYPLKSKLCTELNIILGYIFKEIIAQGKFSTKTAVQPDIEHQLTKLGDSISDKNEKEYFYEAVNCFSVNAYRSCIIMIWIITMTKLFNKIEAIGLNVFADAYNNKVKPRTPLKLNSKEDLYYINEATLIETCQDLRFYDKHIKELLLEKLKLRNKCAHPALQYKPSNSAVLNLAEDIVVNVLPRL